VSERVPYPGYRACWTSTKDWEREPGGPFVHVNYTAPDEDGSSRRLEGFVDTFAGARLEALSNRYAEDLELREGRPL
jgi:hypothetical protein